MLVWAYGVISTKKIKNTNTFEINFHLATCLMILGSCLYPFVNNGTSLYRIFTGILFMGIPIAIGAWFFIGGLAMGRNHGVLTMINFTSIVYGELVSYFRYG